MRLVELIALLGVCGALVACETSAAREVKSPATRSAVDSIIPREEALRRFREGTPEVERLRDAASNREAVVEAYVRALEARDTASIARLAITRAEFAWLYYPTTPQGLSPYDVEPGLLWFLLTSRSDKGARRALTTYGGRQHEVIGQDCGATGNREGKNTIWGPCTVHWVGERGDTVSKQLIGQIIERDGQFKVLSYSNDL
jgi:hypothetical protein